MKKNISALLCGLIFGAGLSISGMSDPDKVQNFLNILGQWDASLIFVLGGAVVTTTIGYFFVFKRKAPIFSEQFYVPLSTVIDRKLLFGAALFGLGWGMTGYCPGPAFSGLAFGAKEPWIFVASLFFGYGLYNFLFLNKKSN